MPPRPAISMVVGCVMILSGAAPLLPARETVATAIYAKVDRSDKRQKAKDGSFKPEYYALSNGGRIEGPVRDNANDRVTYPKVAEIAARLWQQQNYHAARSRKQATLLVVLKAMVELGDWQFPDEAKPVPLV